MPLDLVIRGSLVTLALFSGVGVGNTGRPSQGARGGGGTADPGGAGERAAPAERPPGDSDRRRPAEAGAEVALGGGVACPAQPLSPRGSGIAAVASAVASEEPARRWGFGIRRSPGGRWGEGEGGPQRLGLGAGDVRVPP